MLLINLGNPSMKLYRVWISSEKFFDIKTSGAGNAIREVEQKGHKVTHVDINPSTSNPEETDGN